MQSLSEACRRIMQRFGLLHPICTPTPAADNQTTNAPHTQFLELAPNYLQDFLDAQSDEKLASLNDCGEQVEIVFVGKSPALSSGRDAKTRSTRSILDFVPRRTSLTRTYYPAKRKRRDGPTTVKREVPVLHEIAKYFDEKSKALDLLTKHFKDGYIQISEGAVAVKEFHRLHKEAWKRRLAAGVPHSLAVLESSLIRLKSASSSPYSRRGPLPNLDDIERSIDREGQYQSKYGKYYRD